MPDPLPAGLAGKGKRVAGVFAIMIGASIILDTHAVWIGLPVLAVGATLLGWGIVEARKPAALASATGDTTTESS